jgi:splicing suppressor protein 51
MKAQAYCPHPSHTRTRLVAFDDDPEARKPLSGGAPPAHVDFDCPHCGIPVACCEEHWAEDYENHVHYCDILRQINEDDHDLHSGREFWELYDYPKPHIEEAKLNFANWDTLLFTRGFDAVNDERHLRQLTKTLTYPMTIGTVLHEQAPYTLKNKRLTVEGLKSFSGMIFFYSMVLPDVADEYSVTV